jgi:hypothetical protein
MALSGKESKEKGEKPRIIPQRGDKILELTEIRLKKDMSKIHF